MKQIFQLWSDFYNISHSYNMHLHLSIVYIFLLWLKYMLEEKKQYCSQGMGNRLLEEVLTISRAWPVSRHDGLR